MIKGKRLAFILVALAWMASVLCPFSPPPGIVEFYEDYNFVTSFSTPDERDMLIGCFPQEVLPEDIRTERMNHVFRLMKKLYSRIARVDPKMVQHVGPRSRYIKCFFHSELLDIKKFQQKGKKAVVEIHAYAVAPEFVNRYIRQYEANQDEEEKVPPVEDRIESAKNHIAPKTEFHIWLHQDGNWMKAEHKNVYIKN